LKKKKRKTYSKATTICQQTDQTHGSEGRSKDPALKYQYLCLATSKTREAVWQRAHTDPRKDKKTQP
jgi:hypothetical protein